MFSSNDSIESRFTRSRRPLRRVKAFSNLSSLSIELTDSIPLLATVPKLSTMVTDKRTQRKLKKRREGQSKVSTDTTSSITLDLAPKALVRSGNRHTSIIDSVVVSPGSLTNLPAKSSSFYLQIAPGQVNDIKPKRNFGRIQELFSSMTRHSHTNLSRIQISYPTNPMQLTDGTPDALVRASAYQAPNFFGPDKHEAVESIPEDSQSSRRCAALSSHPIRARKTPATSQKLIPDIILTAPSQVTSIPIDSAPAWKEVRCREALHPMDEAFKLTTQKAETRSRHFSEQLELLSGTIVMLESQVKWLKDDIARQEKVVDIVSTLHNSLKLKYRNLLNAHGDLQRQLQELSHDFRFPKEPRLNAETDILLNVDKETPPIELPIMEPPSLSTPIVGHQVHELSASASNEVLRTTPVDMISTSPKVSHAATMAVDRSQLTVEGPQPESAVEFVAPSSHEEQARSDQECEVIETEEPTTLFRFGSRRVQSAPAVQRVRFSQSDVDGGQQDDAFLLRLASWEWVSMPNLELFDPRHDGGL